MRRSSEIGEHIFPAALGGRRTNKGTYCGAHNGAYSPLAATISGQLKAINGLLSVRGDHAAQPHSVVLTEPGTGRSIQRSGGSTSMFPEVTSDLQETARGSEGTMTFSSKSALRAWVAEKERAGFKVTLPKRLSVQTRYLETSHVRMSLGGTEGLRAVGYVAQTFLAHHFPSLARLDGVKPFLLETLGTEMWRDNVWWETHSVSDKLKDQRFPFGHRVVVGTDPEEGVAYGHVSLFSTWHFAMIFGPIGATKGRTVITDIDPLAQFPPNDWAVESFDECILPVSRPAVATQRLSESIRDRSAENAMNTLMEKIEERQLQLDAGELLKQLQQIPNSADDRERLFAEALKPNSQRVLNIMRYVAREMPRSDPALAFLATSLSALVSSDANEANGLSKTATHALGAVNDALLDRVLAEDAKGALDQNRLAMLLGGGLGAELAGRVMISIIAPSESGTAT